MIRNKTSYTPLLWSNTVPARCEGPSKYTLHESPPNVFRWAVCVRDWTKNRLYSPAGRICKSNISLCSGDVFNLRQNIVSWLDRLLPSVHINCSKYKQNHTWAINISNQGCKGQWALRATCRPSPFYYYYCEQDGLLKGDSEWPRKICSLGQFSSGVSRISWCITKSW